MNVSARSINQRSTGASTDSEVTPSIQTPIENVQSLERQQIVEIQKTLGHGDEFGIWRTPLEWFPQANHSLLNINLKTRIVQCLEGDSRHAAELTDTSKPKDPTYHGPNIAVESINKVSELLDFGTLVFTRYLVLCRIGPVGMKKSTGRPLDASHIAMIASNYFCVLLAKTIEIKIKEILADQTVFVKNITSEIPRTLFDSFEATLLNDTEAYVQEKCRIELNRMLKMADRGIWFDVPLHTKHRSSTTPVKGPAILPDAERLVIPHRPLPDDYVAEMGAKVLWIVENIGPSLLAVTEQLVQAQNDSQNDVRGYKTLAYSYKRVLSRFEWRDKEGNLITRLPFDIQLNQPGPPALVTHLIERFNVESFEPGVDEQPPIVDSYEGHTNNPTDLNWPPRNFAQAMRLAATLQASHMFIVGLSMAARASELLSMQRSCIVYARDGNYYARGKTFKLVLSKSGETRDWILPDAAVHAIEQQARLIALSESLNPATPHNTIHEVASGTHLWGTHNSGTRDRTMPLRNPNSALRALARVLGMSEKPGGQALRSHRFRKTIARLVALAVSDAPKILQDVFGHKSIEMTLYYILSDEELQGEIETVTRELRIMRAQEIVEDMVKMEISQEKAESQGTETHSLATDPGDEREYGGLASISIYDTVVSTRSTKINLGLDWGAKDAYELAEILTLQGRTWELVRPGVICTKSIGQTGPCNYKKGRPEPSLCRSECNHRLEENWLWEEVDGAIECALQAYLKCQSESNDLMAEFWAGQIRNSVVRFPSLEKKWMENEVVRHLMNAITEN